jgi:hypothetical protein
MRKDIEKHAENIFYSARYSGASRSVAVRAVFTAEQTTTLSTGAPSRPH